MSRLRTLGLAAAAVSVGVASADIGSLSQLSDHLWDTAALRTMPADDGGHAMLPFPLAFSAASRADEVFFLWCEQRYFHC